MLDLAPVTFAVSGSNVLVVNPAVAANTVRELIAFGRAHPGKLAYGSSGSGNAGHLAGELFKSMARIDMIHMPYKGGAPAMIDLIAGQTQLVFSSPPTAVPQVKAGKIKALTVTTARRSCRNCRRSPNPVCPASMRITGMASWWLPKHRAPLSIASMRNSAAS